MADIEHKNCPYCGNKIKINAIKCKYCKTFLPEHSEVSTITCPYCGDVVKYNAKKCKHCGEWLNIDNDDYIIENIAKCQQLSNRLWIIISVIQIITIIFAIIGIWNLIVTIQNKDLPQLIRAKYVEIPNMYESVTGLLIAGVLNFLFGGVIGVVLIGFEFYIRHLVLTNKRLFICS